MLPVIRPMKHAISLLAVLTVSLAMFPVFAIAADSGLQGGGAVSVDPITNRATITRDGVTVPLWDGTHRMDDGSTLIIRQGISVPRETVPESRRRSTPKAAHWEGTLIVGYSPCEKLVQRVCGMQDECGDSEGCNLARQLLAMEDGERAESGNRNRMTYTSGECHEVSADREIFPACH